MMSMKIALMNCFFKKTLKRCASTLPIYSEKSIVLGIETSFDDTGVGIVNGSGALLGDTLYSQSNFHLRFGGLFPRIAYEFHKENIENAFHETLRKSGLTINEIDAIAVTVKPGIVTSLKVGVQFAKYLARKHDKPLIYVHHMEAHALVARMYNELPFPYVTLLISGGHSLLAVVKNTDSFLLLGECLDNAPGEVLDKIARRLKLKNISKYSKLPGGRAIELAAESSQNVHKFDFTIPLLKSRDCNFSFSGLKDAAIRKISAKEKEHAIMGDGIIPEVNDFCFAFQSAVTKHIAHRTERALVYCDKYNVIPEANKNFVISGGMAANNFIFNSLTTLGKRYNYNVYRPPPHVCTDNGIMIAWNGVEILKLGHNIHSENIISESQLGRTIISEVIASNLHVKLTKLSSR